MLTICGVQEDKYCSHYAKSSRSQISNHWRQNTVANSLILWYILYQFSNR